MSKSDSSSLLTLTIVVTAAVAAWLIFDVIRTVMSLNEPLGVATSPAKGLASMLTPVAREQATIPVVPPESTEATVAQPPGITPPRPPNVRAIDPRAIHEMQMAEAERLREQMRNPQNDDAPVMTPERAEKTIQEGSISW